MPSSTTLYKQLNFERSNLTNLKVKSKGLITFKFKEERYNLPVQTLYATNSEYFKSICDYAMVENEKGIYEIEVDEMPVPFKQMLSFILSGFIPDPFNYHMLRDLLIMASKYNVQTLKILCESYLIRMINIENCIDLVQLAFSYNAYSLKKHTSLFIKLYLKEVLRTKEFQRLSQNNLEEIIELISNINLPLDIKLPHVNIL
ncbi:TD and POZ domain-containing protein 4 [Camponotus floridanus]|uniref:TD and POZ domain-containing protein 4 n=1 Tax=Camponotus floridanus TaxID=104421 RepID=E2AJE8_CAMFO|nr:TD and POZ domain-containing protein 4 [Camponotus floridanus]